jgi:hypothetical protein
MRIASRVIEAASILGTRWVEPIKLSVEPDANGVEGKVSGEARVCVGTQH